MFMTHCQFPSRRELQWAGTKVRGTDMRTGRKELLIGLSTIAVAIGSITPAFAQDVPATAPTIDTPGVAPAEQFGGAIVVTARKRREDTLNVPIAIASYDAKQLARSGVTGLRDLAAMTPGLTFQDVNGAYAAPTIRGMVQIDQTSLQGNVGVFIDGVYLNNRTGLEFGMLELDRVEIDKGPQSALYGRNTFAGAINYITVQPVLGKVAGNASVEVGNDGLQTYKGGVNVPIGDTAAIRLFAGWGKFDGTIRNDRTGDNLGGYKGDQAYGGSFLWKPADRLTVKLFGSYSKVNNSAEPLAQPATSNNNCGSTSIRSGVAFNTLFCGSLPKVTSVNVDQSVSYGTKGDNKLAYGTLAYDADFATFSATGSYDKGSYSNLVDTTANPAAITIPTSGGYSAQNFVEAVTPDSTDKSLDLRMQSNGNTALTYTLGLYGYDSSLTNLTSVSHQLLNQPNSAPVAFSTSGGHEVLDGRAIYGALGYKLTPALTLNAELRWTHEHQKFNGVGSAATYLGTAIQGKQSFNYWTPRFTANYAFTHDVVGYASAARGAKTGGFNSNAFGVAQQYFTYGMETNWTYELGVKSSLMGGKLRLTADAYYIDWKGIQGQRSAPGSVLAVVSNLGDAHVHGVEGSGTYYFTPHLSLTANGSYTDPRYQKGFIDGDLAAACGDYVGSTVSSVGCSDDVGGNQMERTSKWQYAISGNWQIPQIVNGIDAYVQADYNYQSGKYTTGNDLQDQGAIKLANARVGIIHNNIEFALWVKNMFDYKYADRVTIAPSTTDGAPTSGITYLRYYPGERRTYGMRIDYRF
jgi:iron complex outermembrane receptor protein